ncbi:MAG: AraC family transcriptional regulator [Chitinophagaceae bacterium]
MTVGSRLFRKKTLCPGCSNTSGDINEHKQYIIKKNSLPKQLLLKNRNIQLIRLDKYIHELSDKPHRHDHYTLMWITHGHGSQRINGNEYEMLTDRVFFLRPGQIHSMLDFDRGGWLLLFSEVVYKLFSKYHPLEAYFGMMDLTGEKPYIDLTENAKAVFASTIQLIQLELSQGPPNENIASHLASLLLLTANQLYHARKKQPENNKVKDLIRRLKLLVEDHFRTEQHVTFYAEKLNLQPRRLNDIARNNTGQSVHQMLEERLLTESKILLSSSAMTVKEISYNLGFNDPSYFNRFFKRNVGNTPVQFRVSKMG